MEMIEKPKVLIDGDIFVYKAAVICAREYDWGDGRISNVCDVREGIDIVNSLVDPIAERFEAREVIYCFSDASENGFRRELFAPYKAHRGTVLPMPARQAIKEHYLKTRQSVLWGKMEADDVLGVLATSDPLNCLIVSTDKDMQTLPAWRFNPDKDTQPQFSTEAEANYWLLFQTLTGDSTDGYPGCKGVGPVKAEKLLRTVPLEDAWAGWLAVVAAFEKAGQTVEFAKVQAQMARICRIGDISEEGEYVWDPTVPSSWALGTRSNMEKTLSPQCSGLGSPSET